MTVFMLLVQEMIPPTSDTVPLVAKFYTASMVEMGVSVVIACYNLHLYFIDPQFYEMPNWMRKLVLGIVNLVSTFEQIFCCLITHFEISIFS